MDRFDFQNQTGNVSNRGDLKLEYTDAQDSEKPAVTATSIPPALTKVKEGDPIKVTVTARDNANSWQTGIKRMRLKEAPAGVANFDSAPCDSAGLVRTKEFTYTVPASPPDLVKLTAQAQDFRSLLGEFQLSYPTKNEEWTGTLVMTVTSPNSVTNMTANVTLKHDGRGNVTGSLSGESPISGGSPGGECTMDADPKGTFSAKIVGGYTSTQRRMSLLTQNVRFVPGMARVICLGKVMGEHPYGEYAQGGSLGDPLTERVLGSLSVDAAGNVTGGDEGPLAAQPGARIKTAVNLKPRSAQQQ